MTSRTGSLMNYDPNLTNSGRMARHLVKLTFGAWDYRMAFVAAVSGNVRGFDAIAFAVEQAFEDMQDTDGRLQIVLHNVAGDSLIDDVATIEDFRKLVIATEIKSIESKEI